MTEWERANAALDEIDAAIRRKWEEKLAWAYANTTGWELRQLQEKRAAIEAQVRNLAREHNVIRFVPRNKAPAAPLSEAVG